MLYDNYSLINFTNIIGNHFPFTNLSTVYPLPKPKDWITCRGSNPIYRGYTCSLWLLWHTLSVNEYLHANGQLTNHQVAFTMRSFIRDFFSCQECREHFVNETINMVHEINQLDPFSSIQYLWSIQTIIKVMNSFDIETLSLEFIEILL